MRITCDKSCNMGYIYLIDNHRYNYTGSASIKDIVGEELCKVDQYSGFNLRKLFEGITIQPTAYIDAVESAEVIEEYMNDRLDSEHILGIELNLSYERLLELIKGRAFRYYESSWGGQECFMVTFDKVEVIFSENIRIYPLTIPTDTYVVCSEKDARGDNRTLAVISTRFDIYDIEYLKTVDFVVS